MSPSLSNASRLAALRKAVLPFPGLTASAQDVRARLEELVKRLAVAVCKERRSLGWVVFLGGTGTGKSTVFNALCGKPLSESGVERPKTSGPVAYAHRDARIHEIFPFPSMAVRREREEEAGPGGRPGAPEEMLVLEHRRGELAHMVLVDTPDLDSLEYRNRRIARDFYLLADVVVFVASQEKYADEVLFQFLRKVESEGKDCFFILNKADANVTVEDLVLAFRQQGLHLPPDRFRLLPYAFSHPFGHLRQDPRFLDLVEALLGRFSRPDPAVFLEERKRRDLETLRHRSRGFLALLEAERRAADQWTEKLDGIYHRICEDLFLEQQKRFSAESRHYLQKEIRLLFSRYDILAKPRQWVGRIVKAPLRFLGLGSDEDSSSGGKLERARRKTDFTPIVSAVEKFHRAVLEQLSPQDPDAPLREKLRAAGTVLDEKEIRRRVGEEQERVALWLREACKKLEEEIPRGKKWGIYSTYVLWGVLVLSFEAVVGGGFGVVDATVDSALAPFVTKGTVEWFAYREIERTARELAERYKEALRSVVRAQKERYEEALRSLAAFDPVPAHVKTLEEELRRATESHE